MSRFIESAKAFVDALDVGKGWEGVKEVVAAEDTPFSCDCLESNTIKEYSNEMAVVSKVTIPDFKYEILSLASNDTEVVMVLSCSGTHTGEGGPKPPENPPRTFRGEYAYTIRFNSDGKIVNMHKVMDKYTTFSSMGWL
ncbi:Polyketide cyclase [Balamuthia mandrillaris]